MKLCSELEVDVNGEDIFFVNKEILCSFSNNLNKLLSKSPEESITKPLKVILHDLPGGAEASEHLTKFCFENSRILITPTNACLLCFVAQSMEVTENADSLNGLIKQAEKAVQGISDWSWPEVLTALQQCQSFFPFSDSSEILDKVLDSLVARITIASDCSTSTCSPDSSVLRRSFDTKSNISLKNSHHRAWWFEDLVILSMAMIDKIIRRMISLKVEHAKISRFLFYYLKCKLSNLASDEKRKVTETVIELLYSLHRDSVSCKGLFDILRISSSQNLSSCCRDRLEIMIGSQIDQATLDNLLISSPTKTESLYDVNILIRFLTHFLSCGGRTTLARLKKVAGLLDLYMAEVAPDIFLKHSKFVELITALPDIARDSHDSLYRAIDMFLQVHNRLSEAEKMKICCTINYEKLSLQSCKHLAQNSKFPPRTAVQALLSQQSKIKGLLQESNHFRSFNGEQKQSKDGEQIILYDKKVDPLMENEKLRAHLQGMRWKVIELEKACRKMQNQMTKMVKTKSSCPTGSRSLPRLCS